MSSSPSSSPLRTSRRCSSLRANLSLVFSLPTGQTILWRRMSLSLLLFTGVIVPYLKVVAAPCLSSDAAAVQQVHSSSRDASWFGQQVSNKHVPEVPSLPMINN
ncbi:unnamed protein product [Urochloa humidicola]